MTEKEPKSLDPASAHLDDEQEAIDFVARMFAGDAGNSLQRELACRDAQDALGRGEVEQALSLLDAADPELAAQIAAMLPEQKVDPVQAGPAQNAECIQGALQALEMAAMAEGLMTMLSAGEDSLREMAEPSPSGPGGNL